jgi:hypothetical protein
VRRENSSNPPSTTDLKGKLWAAGFKSTRLNERTRGVVFCGRVREWLVAVTEAGAWLNLAVTFCSVPDEPGLRSRLIERAMERNRWLGLLKFGALNQMLVFELDYRWDHVDANVLAELIRYIVTTADDEYPAVFRIVSGDAALDALGATMEPGPAA